MPKKVNSKNISPAATKPKVAPKKPRIAAKGHKLPDPLPAGEILTDVKKRRWRLGQSIGLGGFGEIYLASEDTKKAAGSDAKYVIKIEPHSNGPLFTEMHFYHRVGTSEQINEWMQKKKLKFLGMPRFIGSGSHEFKGTKYRFMILERFGEDLQKLLEKNNRFFPLKTVYTLGIKVLDILEYIHSHGYIHADVKASNLMSGFGAGKQNEVHLIDFGLACRFITSQGVHKEYKEDLRKAHDGTIEFTSRDAHIGAHSRRGDLEILGYNMLQWMCGRLPWEDNLRNPDYVSTQKNTFMKNIPSLMSKCFTCGPPPKGITEYFKYVASLQFEEEPNYENVRNILKTAIKANGLKNDGKLVYNSPSSSSPQNTKKSSAAKGSDLSPPLKRKMTAATRKITSESSGMSPTPCKKIRRVASAKPRLSSSKTPDSAEKNYASAFDNPTPAMLLVIQRKFELMNGPESVKSKSSSVPTATKAGCSKNGMKENKPLRKKSSSSSWNSEDSDIVVEKKPAKVALVKKRVSPLRVKAPSFKPKKKAPVSSRIKLRIQTNSCSL